MRLKQAPPLAVLAGLPLLGGPSRYAADRCGDAVLSRAGPKPCQTRDGRSWRTGPLFSLCPRVPSPVLPRCEWRVGGGRGAESGPTSLPCPVPCGVGGVGVSVTRRMLRLCLLAVSRRRPLPTVGRAVSPPRRAPFRARERVPPAVGGAPGAFQVVPQAPEAEWRCCSLFPSASSGDRCCAGVSEERGVESVREACPSPSGGTGASSPPPRRAVWGRAGSGACPRVPLAGVSTRVWE